MGPGPRGDPLLDLTLGGVLGVSEDVIEGMQDEQGCAGSQEGQQHGGVANAYPHFGTNGY